MDYENIYMLNNNFSEMGKPENFEEIRKEIISIIKRNNLSLSQSAMIFNSTIKKLGNTPIKEL
ncbi:hypothetical protein [uncultured Eubacterium sp.]|uniref:hypothetical protein n=1 Tax=uncultured Eubacterium sp. TaxID=165185 RepID=UPI0025947FD7|nr:hypothetical protein [uncultured Eubacterium sp.]